MKIQNSKNKTSCLTLPEIESKLRQAGVNPTAQRLAICRYVLCDADHPTAEQVKQWADQNFPKMSLATVYNTLNILVGAGLLKEFKFPHLDQAIYDNNTHDHHHFLDQSTGELIDLEPNEIQITHDLNKKFKVNEISVLIQGRVKSETTP